MSLYEHINLVSRLLLFVCLFVNLTGRQNVIIAVDIIINYCCYSPAKSCKSLKGRLLLLFVVRGPFDFVGDDADEILFDFAAVMLR